MHGLKWLLRIFYVSFAAVAVAAPLTGAPPAITAGLIALNVLGFTIWKLRARIIEGLIGELQQRNRELIEAAHTREALQAAAFEQEKLSSLGLLAAGVAHEINNPMSYILANVQAVKEVLEELPSRNDELQEFVDKTLPATLDGIRRVNAIVADLRKFSRGDQQQMSSYSLTEQVRAALRIANSQVKRTCSPEVALEEHCPTASGYPQQLVQVFINLLVNAAEAQPPGTLGKIEVRSGSGGGEVWVSIKDTGTGMSPEVKAKLFQPFFTTKGAGKGTGLGLVVSRNIVEAHGGRIEVETALGRGTTFTVHLPLQPPDRDDEVTPLGLKRKLTSSSAAAARATACEAAARPG